MQGQTNIRIIELLRFLLLKTDENHPATVSDIIAYLKEKGIQTVRQTVYGDLNALADAGLDIVVTKSKQNQYFIGLLQGDPSPKNRGADPKAVPPDQHISGGPALQIGRPDQPGQAAQRKNILHHRRYPNRHFGKPPAPIPVL